MALKQFLLDFQELGKDLFLRFDYDYFEIKHTLDLDHVDKLKKYLTFLETGKPIVPEDYSSDETDNVHIVVRNIIDGKFEESDLIFISDEKAEELKKYRIEKGDIVIAISSNCGSCFYYDGNNKRNLTLSHYLARFRVDEDAINPIFLNYYINSKVLKQYFRSVETGKTLKNLSKHYIKELPILIPDKYTQDKIVAKIEPIEQKIKKLKNTIKKPHEVINKVFAREFGFDENLYNEFGKGMTAGTQNAKERKLRAFDVDFKEIMRSNILRFSTRYHNPPTIKLMDFLDTIDTLLVKDVIMEATHRGASPNYNPDGDIPVVKTGHLKNGYIEISQEEFVNDAFYKASERSQLRENDILIASTGKISLGKIDLVETDDKLVADGHVSIVRIDNKKYNYLFFVYFFRCIAGYFQIERDFTGATNQIELYSDEISNFQIPDISLQKQRKIVEEITAELDKQNKINKKIESERSKIDEIIETAMS